MKNKKKKKKEDEEEEKKGEGKRDTLHVILRVSLSLNALVISFNDLTARHGVYD